MELTYSDQLSGFDPEKRYRNPEHFDKPEAGVTSVLVIGDWPSVVNAYETAGIDVSVKEAKRAQIVRAGRAIGRKAPQQLGKTTSIRLATSLGRQKACSAMLSAAWRMRSSTLQ